MRVLPNAAVVFWVMKASKVDQNSPRFNGLPQWSGTLHATVKKYPLCQRRYVL